MGNISKVPKFPIFLTIDPSGSEWSNNGKKLLKIAEIEIEVFGRKTRLEGGVGRNIFRKFQSSQYISQSLQAVQNGKIMGKNY